MKTIDVSGIKARADLLSVVEADLGPSTRQCGRWFSFVCPFHNDGDRDGGSLRVTPDTGKWFCFGCHAHGDALDWLQRRDGLKFREAAAQLGGQSVGSARPALPLVPAKDWQGAADRAVTMAETFLWHSGSGFAYLHGRGLSDDTIRLWHIGYNPGSYRVPEITNGRGDSASVARGVTIPAYANGAIAALKIRQPDGFEPKYMQLYGSRPTLFGIDRLSGKSTVVLTEGEFDAMLLYQEAGDLVDVASTTGGAKTWRREWSIHLLAARTILLAYDTDPTGEEAAAMMAVELGARARRVSVPSGKDLTDYWKSGGNVRDWIVSLLGGPPRPTSSCPICSGTEWTWAATSQWACSVCGPMDGDMGL